MFTQYDKKDLKITVQILKDQLKDLEKWSVHNDDKFSEEIDTIKNILNKLK